MERDALRTALVGMPIYFQAMITFAAVFLIKATRSPETTPFIVDRPTVLRLLENLLTELRKQKAAPQHLVFHLLHGFEESVKTLLNPDLGGAGVGAPNWTWEDTPTSSNTMNSLFTLDTFSLFQYPTHEYPGL